MIGGSISKPNVVFPDHSILQRAVDTLRPDLSYAFRRSSVRRVLKRADYTVKSLWSHNSVSPLVELFGSDPDVFSGVVERWRGSVLQRSGKALPGVSLVWSDGVRERQVSTPFHVSGWLRFMTLAEGSGGGSDSFGNEVAAAVLFGVPEREARLFSSRREVMVPGVPMLSLAAFHLDVSVPQSVRLVEMFELYSSMVYRNDNNQSVYEALRRDVSDYYYALAVRSGGVVEDVPLWLVFSCITHAGRAELSVLIASGIDPVRAVYLWFMGFDFVSLVNVIVFDMDLDMACSVFSPRVPRAGFDLSVQPSVSFVPSDVLY